MLLPAPDSLLLQKEANVAGSCVVAQTQVLLEQRSDACPAEHH